MLFCLIMNILIKNGFIVDGIGTPKYKADVLVKGDTIVKIGSDLTADKAKVIDASNTIVSPGFIDIHNHGDLNIVDANKAESFVMQGMTTLLVSVCGLGIAPANDFLIKFYKEFISRAMCASPTIYKDFHEMRKALEEMGFSINLAFMVPHINVRSCVMEADMRQATQEELSKMKQIVREGMEFGAFGLSTGLDYPPGSTTNTEEFIELSKVVSEYDGIYNSHMRNNGAKFIEIGMKELIRIAREANVRAHISHWMTLSQYNTEVLVKEAIQLVEDVRNGGLEITADVVPYDDGVTSLPFVLLNTWVFENFIENLSNPETRKQIKEEVWERLSSAFLADAPFVIRLIPKFLLKRLAYPKIAKSVKVLHIKNNRQFLGKTMYETLTKLYPGKKLEDSMLDFMRDEEGEVLIIHMMKDEQKSVIPFYKQPFSCVSSDSNLNIGGNSHPRAYGTFPRVISRWVRDMNIIYLEEAIRKMTSLPASILQINDRGLIKEGYKADLVIFNYDLIKEMGTIENGNQFPEGIQYVIVNGEITCKHGEHTGALNGKVLRHPIPKGK